MIAILQHLIQQMKTALFLKKAASNCLDSGVKLNDKLRIYISARHCQISFTVRYFFRNIYTNGGMIFQPMTHTFGVMLMLCYLRSGQKAIIMPQFDLEKYISYIQTYRVRLTNFNLFARQDVS